MQVGGAPTQKVTKSQLTIMQVGERAQHREFQKKFYRQCSWRGPNTEGDEKSAYNNVQVGEQRNKFYENIISIPLLRITT